MKIEIINAVQDDKEVISNLLQLYVHDLSEYEGFDVDPHGRFLYSWLDHYWTDEGRHPYLIRVAGRWAGFVLVNQHTEVSDAGHSIAEFFVLRKYRRQGIGRRVARDVLQLFPGKWEVRQTTSNASAQSFWRSVIAGITEGRYEEFDAIEGVRQGPTQVFEVHPIQDLK